MKMSSGEAARRHPVAVNCLVLVPGAVFVRRRHAVESKDATGSCECGDGSRWAGGSDGGQIKREKGIRHGFNRTGQYEMQNSSVLSVAGRMATLEASQGETNFSSTRELSKALAGKSAGARRCGMWQLGRSLALFAGELQGAT